MSAQRNLKTHLKSTKTRIAVVGLLATLSLLQSATSYACRFNSDCNYGSKCQKHGMSDQGVCTGGKRPGNSNDWGRILGGGGGSSVYGNACLYNSDCGFGFKCDRPGVDPGICLK